jgi:ABC-type proline/glycine betaine transport system permease subunit
VVAGILYSPICLFEWFAGPQAYAHLYGFQPYRWIGATRYFRFRPVGFLEDGNQLGIWMASSALIASALWARGLAVRVLRLPVPWAAAYLLGVALLCQSVGSILLLGLLLPLACFSGRRSLRVGIALVLFGLVLYAGLELSHHIPWRELSKTNPVAHSIADNLRDLGRKSLGWRLGRDETQAAIALGKPLLGFGTWDWWQRGGTRPWDLWLLIFGMYGAVGVVAIALLFSLPIVRAAYFSMPGAAPGLSSLLTALAALVLMSALDSLLNGAFLLPYLLVVGGLSADIHPDQDCHGANAPALRRRRYTVGTSQG